MCMVIDRGSTRRLQYNAKHLPVIPIYRDKMLLLTGNIKNIFPRMISVLRKGVCAYIMALRSWSWSPQAINYQIFGAIFCAMCDFKLKLSHKATKTQSS